MRRLRKLAPRVRSGARTALALLPLLLAACKVERTPQEFFDHRTPVETEREAAAEELRDRLLAFGEALQRGSTIEALAALAPATDAYVLGPDDALIVTGAEQIGLALERLADTPVAVEVRDLEVSVGPRANVAWFRGVLTAPGRGPQGTAFRITGVFVRSEGAWTLVQAHLSLPVSPLAAPPPNPPEAAAAPAEGE